MLEVILTFISNLKWYEKAYDVFIVVVAVAIFIVLIRISRALDKTLVDSEGAYSQTNRETRLNSKGNLSQESYTEFSSEKYEPIRRDFNKMNVAFISAVNLISILPLLGLLGTVGGLIPGLQAVKNQNFEVLYSSLSTALSSTFFGLVASILLKLYVSLGPEKKINSIDITFNEIDRKYSNAIGLKKIENS